MAVSPPLVIDIRSVVRMSGRHRVAWLSCICATPGAHLDATQVLLRDTNIQNMTALAAPTRSMLLFVTSTSVAIREAILTCYILHSYKGRRLSIPRHITHMLHRHMNTRPAILTPTLILTLTSTNNTLTAITRLTLQTCKGRRRHSHHLQAWL
jgi:hypothetical protein